MANPVVVACPAGQWTKVATGVTTVTVKVISEAPAAYYETYRLTLGPAPTDLSDSVPFTKKVEYGLAAASDIYVYAANEAGSVRVDT